MNEVHENAHRGDDRDDSPTDARPKVPIDPTSLISGLELVSTPALFKDAQTYVCHAEREGLKYQFAPGHLAGAPYLSVDLLIDGPRFVTFRGGLLCGEQAVFIFNFSVLNWCQTRLVREVPSTVDLSNVDGMTLTVLRVSDPPVRFCVGPVRATSQRPPRLDAPALPRGPLLDETGQSTLHEWPNKTSSPELMVKRLRNDFDSADQAQWPQTFSRWGGLYDQRLPPTGFFGTHHDGRRWWLVDPDGHPFWSSGLDCVHTSIDHEVRYKTREMDLTSALNWVPPRDGEFASIFGRNPYHHEDDREINFLAANFIRAFGADQWYEGWSAIALATLRRTGFNTIGNWSDEALAAGAGFPYVRPLELGLRGGRTPMLVGQVPDVYHADLEQDADRFAKQLASTADDPALIGYFLHNEPPWWFGDGLISPAEQMLREDARGASRSEFTRYLRRRYTNDDALAAGWGAEATFAKVAEGAWPEPFPPQATHDLEEFSTAMLTRLFRTLSDACRRVDPHHLNLGVRWWTFPPRWALKAMGCFDVISFNYYTSRIDMAHYGHDRDDDVADICAALGRPFLIGEWSFGAFDAGLPAAGLAATRTEQDRGGAFRNYFEHAAAQPWCVGAHWFNLYDRTALYCPQANENLHIGFYDITHRPHQALCAAARLSNDRLYHVATGELPPCSEPVEFVFPSR